MPSQIVQEAEKILSDDKLEQPRIFKKILYGQKTILFDFVPADLPHFVKLHREDMRGFLHRYCLKKMTEQEGMKFTAAMFLTGQLKCWSVYLKQNSIKNLMENKRAGFIYIDNLTSFSANISGVMDSAVMKGLLKQIRRDKVTFAEDSSRTLINHLFSDLGLHRIETSVLADNRRSLALMKKIGFVEEGRLRESFRLDDEKFVDVVQFGLLKKEWENDKR